VLTDKLGAFKVLVLGLIGTSLLLIGYRFIGSPEALLALRFLHGFIGGLIVPAAFTFVANQSKKNKEGSQNAITGAFVGIAAIVGPAFSGIVAARTSVPTVFISVAVFGFLLSVITLFSLRSRKLDMQKQNKQSLPVQWNKQLIASFTGAFLLMCSQGAL